MTAMLLELADRCEAAEAKDRNLDTEILWHCDRARFQRGYWNAASGMPRPLDRMPSPNSGLGYIGAQCSAPVYTASLDAALTLVPEGWEWMVRGPCRDAAHDPALSFARLESPDFESVTYGKGEDWLTDVLSGQDAKATAATAPLVLCAAALRARASLTQSKGDRDDQQ